MQVWLSCKGKLENGLGIVRGRLDLDKENGRVGLSALVDLDVVREALLLHLVLR